MPVYEYGCEDCGRRFEVILSLAEKEAGPVPDCPYCGGSNCAQVFGKVNIFTSVGSDDEFDDLPDDDYGGDDSDYDDEFGADELD